MVEKNGMDVDFKSFAIRLYGTARGRGFAKEFSEAAVKLYNQLGFIAVTAPDENERFRMIRYR